MIFLCVKVINVFYISLIMFGYLYSSRIEVWWMRTIRVTASDLDQPIVLRFDNSSFGLGLA